MCKELKLIQFKLGVYKVKNWNINECSLQFTEELGIYVLVNTKTWKYLIGEGLISRRIISHYNGDSNNKEFKNDLKKHGNNSLKLIGFILEKDEEKRKEIEYYLHCYYKSKSYNTPRPPKNLIIKLYQSGKSKIEIQNILKCGMQCIYKYTKSDKSSKQSVSYCTTSKSWIAKFESKNKLYCLGKYNKEIEAAENKDYFIWKNNLLDKVKLNYHNIDYSKFKPHLMRNGELNKHLK